MLLHTFFNNSQTQYAHEKRERENREKKEGEEREVETKKEREVERKCSITKKAVLKIEIGVSFYSNFFICFYNFSNFVLDKIIERVNVLLNQSSCF